MAKGKYFAIEHPDGRLTDAELWRDILGDDFPTLMRPPEPRAGARKGRVKRDEPIKSIEVGYDFDTTDPNAADWADGHAAELAVGLSEDTRDDIADALVDAFSGDIDSQELIDRIGMAVGDENRGELIARTEAMKAASEGQREAWRQAVDQGTLTGDEEKEWITVGDDKVCPECESLDGATTDIDGQYPDPGGDGPPQHPRCRCTEGITAPRRGKGRGLGGPGSGNFGHSGRPGEVGGSGDAGSDAAVDKTVRDARVSRVLRRTQDMAEAMHFDAKRIDVVDKEPRAFKVGDQEFREAGHYDPSTGRIEINARNSNDDRMNVTYGLVAHEVTHAMYDAVTKLQEAEHQAILNMSAADTKKYFNAGGFVRPEYMDELSQRFPVSALFARTVGDGFLTPENESLTDRTKIVRERDGVSEYSKAYWSDQAMSQKYSWGRAINETLAETARIQLLPEYQEMGDKTPHPMWKELADGIRQFYPHKVN